MTEWSDAYLRSVALNLNVPAMWVEDCVQELRLALWREGCSNPRQLLHRRAIDFLRQVNGTATNHRLRERMTSLDVGDDDWLGRLEVSAAVKPCDEMIDVSEVLTSMNRRDAQVLLLAAYGYSAEEMGRMLGISREHVWQRAKWARRTLRARAA